MKALSAVMALAMASVGTVAVCQEQRVVDFANTVQREGLRYEVNSIPFTGKIVRYWPNGKKRAESEYRDGKKHGKEITWYENGQKQAESEYRDGQLHGKRIMWNENGRKRNEGWFRYGQRHGEFFRWNENGNEVRSIYDHGELQRSFQLPQTGGE